MSSRVAGALVVMAAIHLPWRAQADTPPPAPVTFVQTEHFGGQVALADAAAIALSIGLAAGTRNRVLLAGGVLGGPTVHAVHGDGAGAVEGLLLRLGLPVAGALIGGALDASNCGSDFSQCGLEGALVGGFVGVLSATAIDASLLSHHTTRVVMAQTPRWSAMPTLAISPHGGAIVGLSARL
jgi:hypothetical protein